MKLEKGMYVRTKSGIIFKYYPCRNNEYDEELNIYSEWDDDGRNYDCYAIANASYSIIDLIEVGDYVNGDSVLFSGATTWDNDGNVLDKKVHINRNGYDLWLRDEYIKTILTKEQYENNCYKVEE